MITNEEKVGIIMNHLNNLEVIRQSFIDNAKILQDKYSLQEELIKCDIRKVVLLNILKDLEGL